jgi:hypothetical protein
MNWIALANTSLSKSVIAIEAERAMTFTMRVSLLSEGSFAF